MGIVVRRVVAGNAMVVGDINDNIPILVRKSANESAPASTITVQDDDELFFAVEANSIYFVQALIRYTAGSNVPDLRLNYSYPAGASFARFDFGPPSGTVAASDTTDWSVATTGDNGRGADATQRAIHMMGDLQIGATPGTFRVRFGQVTSSAALITVNLGSYLMAWKYS